MATAMGLGERVAGALIGGAIGDGMGAPVEGWSARLILDRLAGWDFRQFIPPQDWDGVSAYGKGNGRITDDTLMVEALMEAYVAAGTHLDAYGYVRWLLPRVVNAVVWVPERQREMAIFERLWMPEKYPRWRIELAGADPRTAGVGNAVNCGVAMWTMPVGAVNAGDPQGAYQEAAAMGGAHNESFAVEAAAVLAACHAAAMAGGSAREVVETALALAQDGTGMAIRAAVEAVDVQADLPAFIAQVRRAVEPFDQRVTHAADDHPLMTPTGPSELGRPSRIKSIEELPVALAALAYGDGDFIKTLRAGVCYGRDCDSIAGMACGLFGALHGAEAMPASLREASAEMNKRDFGALAERFMGAVRAIGEADAARLQRRWRAVGVG